MFKRFLYLIVLSAMLFVLAHTVAQANSLPIQSDFDQQEKFDWKPPLIL